MPVGDAFLAQLPAEVDLFAITQAEKVDQARIWIFQLTPKSLHLFKGVAQSLDLNNDLLLELENTLIQVMPVAQRPLLHLFQLCFKSAYLLTILLNFTQYNGDRR